MRRGRRARLDAPERQVTLRRDPDVIDRSRVSGPGRQVRINAIPREALARG
ncbi:BrnA antitoxin family protein [Methylobacterium sp. WSM2598]|uniref:BrnA antitoxin family protein n=1 Tax=Methylobacterium sp. WSM2598 TaxID=398261 RepID=UPI00037B93A1